MKSSICFACVALLATATGCGNGQFGDPGASSAGAAGASVGPGSGGGAGLTGGSPGNGGTSPGAGSGGAAGQPGSSGAGGPGTGSGAGGGPGFTAPASAFSALRKVKTALTGLAPTDAEMVQASSTDGLRSLIDTWMATPEFQSKMLSFFSLTFQQSSLAVLDFEFQLRKRPGAFDLPYAIFGDSAFPLLFQNMKESFARTVLAIIAEKRPLTDILTTQRFMMTSALKSLYMQIETPYDIGSAPVKFNFQFNHGTRL